MGKKVILWVLILTYILMLGCGQKSADQAVGTSLPVTDEAVTEETTPIAENMPQQAVPDTDAEEIKPPEEEVIPQPVSFWNPICNEYISVFEATDSKEAFAKIPVGSTIGLLKWEGRFAQVMYNDQIGYVYAHCLKPADENYFDDKLKVITPTNKYSYEQMQADMKKLQALYPHMVSLSSIGKTGMNRDIPVMVLGQDNAPYHILVQAAIHGREHFTAWLAMAMADYMLLQGKVAEDVCYHIIPMSNPDGVIVSQTGKLEEEQWVVYEMDLEYGYTNLGERAYATLWKANATGVDVNRNFLSGWDPSDQRPEVSSENYRGIAPFSANESAALRDYTTARTFHSTLSLHAYGSVLYYQYGKKEPVNQLSFSLAQTVEGITGYVPTANDNTTGAGYKDWAMEELGIPSLTVEIGGNEPPLSQQEIYNTFDRCREMLPTVYAWVCRNAA